MSSHFFDGSSAKRYDITPEAWQEGVSFSTERGDLAWRYEDLIRLWDYRPSDHLAFTHRKHQDSRLIIEEPALVAAIGRYAPDLLDRKKEGFRSARIAGILAVGVIVVVAAIYFLVPPITDTLARIVPWSFEVEEQPKLAALEKIFGKRCTAGRPNEILKSLTDQLLSASGFPHPIRVDVLDNKMNNAFALPGGRIIVMRGMIREAHSPNELSAVLAHEIGHVVNRDLTERSIRNNALGAITALVFGGNAGTLSDTLFQTGLSLSFSRSDEAAADEYSVDLLNQLDLDPRGGAAFFERLSKSGRLGGILPGYLNTHPESDGRAAYFREHGTGSKQVLSPADWLILKQICIKNG